jgi:hypothetical protein
MQEQLPSGDPESSSKQSMCFWIPAFAGMTLTLSGQAEGRNPAS